MRVEVSIENPGPPLRDHQVLVELPRGVEGALRPVMDGEVLSYWREGAGRLWVKVPYLPQGASRLHVYFGNAEAEDLSSGETAFNFFQNFSCREGLEAWSQVGGSWAVKGGRLLGSSQKAKEGWDLLYVGRAFESQVFEWYGRFRGTYAGVAFIVDEGSFYYVMARIPLYRDYAYGVYRAGRITELGSAGASDEGFHLYRFEVAEGVASFYVDGVRQLAFNVSRGAGRFSFILWDSVEGGVEVCWVRARGYARLEPTVRVGALEDHRPTVVAASIQSPTFLGRGFWVNVTLEDRADDLSRVEVAVSGLGEATVVSWSVEEGFRASSGLASLLDARLRRLELGRVEVCLKLALRWRAAAPTGLDVTVTALDCAGLSGSAHYASAVAVASEVNLRGLSMRPSYCRPGQLVNVTGYAFFKGYEVPAEGLEVVLEGGGLNYTARTDGRGFFSLAFKAPSEVGEYVYRLRLKEACVEAPLSLIVDRVVLSWRVDREEVKAGEEVTFTVLLSYEYDRKPVESYEYTVYRDGAPLGTFREPRFSDSFVEPGLHVYRVVSVVDRDRWLRYFTYPGDIAVRWAPPAYLSADLQASVSSGWLSSKVDVEVMARSGGDQEVFLTLYLDGGAYARRTVFIHMAPSKLAVSFPLDPFIIGYRRVSVVMEPTNGVKAIYESHALIAPLSLYAALALMAAALIVIGALRRRRAHRELKHPPASESSYAPTVPREDNASDGGDQGFLSLQSALRTRQLSNLTRYASCPKLPGPSKGSQYFYVTPYPRLVA
jgi:hypothetical protein